MAIDASGVEVANEQGKIYINGSSYRLEVEDELLVVCDGSAQWMYRHQTEDIIITGSRVAAGNNLEETVQNILEQFVGSAGANGNVSIAKDSNGRANEITVNMGGKAYYKVKLASVTETEAFPDGYFTLNVADYPNAIVTDMR